jgi:hypothetical protein
MKTRAVIGALFALVLLRPNANPETGGSSQAQIDELAKRLASRQVGRVEIFHIPPGMLTRTQITPDDLEQQFVYRLTIRDLRGNAYEVDLGRGVKSMSVQPRGESVDLRWATVFYTTDGARLGALYFDSTGRAGSVNFAPVSFTDNRLFEWLTNHFATCFQ